jgi:serine/threonine protein kinase
VDLISQQSSLEPGTTFAGRYVIERLIGLGGMGEVYLATDSILDHEQVALKIIHADLSTEDKNIKRFQREIQLTRKIVHQNIARTYDAGIADKRFYFSMEYLEGTVLSDYIGAEPLPAIEVCKIIQQVCAGLSAIHKAGVIHRDLKPGNLILAKDGQVKIMDFGIARPGNSNLTKTTEVLGSAPYMAPELWTGNELGAASDLYALGVLFFELLTGVLPLDGETAAELMFKHLEVLPPAPSTISENIPQVVDTIVLKLMSKASSERYDNAEEVSLAIEEALHHGRVKADSEDYHQPEVTADDNLFSDSYPLLKEEEPVLESGSQQKNSSIATIIVQTSSTIAQIFLSNSIAITSAAILYLAIDWLLAPYLAETFIIAQGPGLWYMRVYVTIGYLVTLGLFSSLPLLVVSSSLMRKGINPSLFLTTIARYSLIAGVILTLNAVAFLALFKLDSQHTLGPYLLVLLRQSISSVGQIFLLIPSVNWENAVQMGGRIIVNAPSKLAGTAFVILVPLAAAAYGYYIIRVSGLFYKMRNQLILWLFASLFAMVVLAETALLYGFKIKATSAYTLIRIGNLPLTYSAEQLFCAAINWLLLFTVITFASRVSDRK